jgi:hypothetical protein
MNHIKEFVDAVSLMESRQKRELVLSSQDAKLLRDEIAKLLADNMTLRMESDSTNIVQIDVSGGKW